MAILRLTLFSHALFDRLWYNSLAPPIIGDGVAVAFLVPRQLYLATAKKYNASCAKLFELSRQPLAYCHAFL